MKTPETGQQLQIRSYFANTVQAAIGQARAELGPDALLMNSRSAPPEAQRLGEFEVVFALDPGRSDARVDTPAENVLHHELKELRKELERMHASMFRARFEPFEPSQSADLYWLLLRGGLDQELADTIVRAVFKQLAGAGDGIPRPFRLNGTNQPFRSATCDAATLHRQLVAELELRLAVSAEIPTGGDRAHVVALVGPPGAGKTTTLVKLAITCGIGARRPIELVSMDANRIGAAEQLRSYAAILGAGFGAIETPHALMQTIAEHRNKSLILIDTAGYSSGTMEEARDLAKYLTGNPEIDTHLVLPAPMKPEDLSRTMERFEIFAPAKLIFTRLDETDSFGAMYCTAVRSGKPVSHLTTGQLIPDDLAPATKAAIVGKIVRDPMQLAESAA